MAILVARRHMKTIYQVRPFLEHPKQNNITANVFSPDSIRNFPKTETETKTS